MKGVIKIGFFRKRKKQEIRADTGANNEVSILTFFGITGELTREAALSIPTVSACINKIGETISGRGLLSRPWSMDICQQRYAESTEPALYRQPEREYHVQYRPYIQGIQSAGERTDVLRLPVHQAAA